MYIYLYIDTAKLTGIFQLAGKHGMGRHIWLVKPDDFVILFKVGLIIYPSILTHSSN